MPVVTDLELAIVRCKWCSKPHAMATVGSLVVWRCCGLENRVVAVPEKVV